MVQVSLSLDCCSRMHVAENFVRSCLVFILSLCKNNYELPYYILNR